MVMSKPEGLRERREKRRLRAADLFGQGYRIIDVAGLLRVSYGNCQVWHRRYRRGGPEALRSKGRPGPAKRLSPAQIHQLMGLMLSVMRQPGHQPNDLSLTRIQALIAERYGVHYTKVGVWKLLRSEGIISSGVN
jgi:transposase